MTVCVIANIGGARGQDRAHMHPRELAAFRQVRQLASDAFAM
jgi:hypothetical protein